MGLGETITTKVIVLSQFGSKAIIPERDLNSESLQQQFQAEISLPDERLDLAKAALCIAQLHQPSLDPQPSLQCLDNWAEQIGDRLSSERYPLRIIQTINQYLFEELGFQGNTEDYYDPRNSFLNEVLDRRTGIPITLSLVYLEIAKRLDFPMVGVGMPGHFIIRPQVAEMATYVDPFHCGEVLFAEDCQQRLESIYQRPIQFHPDLLPEVTAKQLLKRMLTNLKLIYLRKNEFGNALNTIDWLLLLSSEDVLGERLDHVRERRDRGLILYELNRWDEAILELERYLIVQPEDAPAIRRLLEYLRGE